MMPRMKKLRVGRLLTKGNSDAAALERLRETSERLWAITRHDPTNVIMADFEESHDRVQHGAAHPQLMDPKERRVVAYHEAGHAIVDWFTPAADPIQKVTIVPHGKDWASLEQVPIEDRHDFSLPYLKARLAVMLGGRTLSKYSRANSANTKKS